MGIEILKLLVGAGAILLIGTSFAIFENRRRLKYIKLNIINQYGKEIDLDEVMIKMNNVSSYFRNKNEKNTIDNITWNDLNMDDVFKKINNTQCTAGQEVLYDILRKPLYNKEVLIKYKVPISWSFFYFNNIHLSTVYFSINTE